jgi:type I restriction-modification system DNA methylase subunit
MFGSFENENVLNQIEHFEKIGFELGANEVVRNDFKKEVKKIIDKKTFDREMDKRRYPKEDEELTKKEKSFESEGSTEGKGKLYEFFTPQIVADKMLALAQHYGFKGGNVLEPATGSGRLIKNLKDSNITAFEISKDNFEILKREFPNAELYNFNFEKAFLNPPRFNTLVNRKGTETWLKNAPFDLVLANPPYKKEFVTFYSSYFNFKGNLEHFFILQTLYLLKKGGLGVYLIPSSFMRNGIAYNETKKKIFEIAELVDAYRLPSNIFEKTQIGTDILILRKK